MKKFSPLFTVFLVFVFGLAMAFAATIGITHDQNTAITGNTWLKLAGGSGGLATPNDGRTILFDSNANELNATVFQFYDTGHTGNMVANPLIKNPFQGAATLEEDDDGITTYLATLSDFKTTGITGTQWAANAAKDQVINASDTGLSEFKITMTINESARLATIAGDLANATRIASGLATVPKEAFLLSGKIHPAALGIIC